MIVTIYFLIGCVWTLIGLGISYFQGALDADGIPFLVSLIVVGLATAVCIVVWPITFLVDIVRIIKMLRKQR